MKAKSKSPIGRGPQSQIADPVSRYCYHCAHIQKRQQEPINTTAKKSTTQRTFLQRSPQNIDNDMTITLLKNQIKALEDELDYWKCRAQQNQVSNDNVTSVYVETLKMENEKWKKKYMDLSNQLKLHTPERSSRINHHENTGQPSYQEYDVLHMERRTLDQQMQRLQQQQNQLMKESSQLQQIINNLKGENIQILDENKSLINQIYKLQEELKTIEQKNHQINQILKEERSLNQQIKNEMDEKVYSFRKELNQMEEERVEDIRNKNDVHQILQQKRIDELEYELQQKIRAIVQMEQDLKGLSQKANQMNSDNISLQSQYQQMRAEYEDQLNKQQNYMKEREQHFLQTVQKLQQMIQHPNQEIGSNGLYYQQDVTSLQGGIGQLKQQILHQQNYTNKVLEEIDIWRNKYHEIQKQKQIELKIKEEEYIYTIEQLKISNRQMGENYENQLQTMKKRIIDTKILENDDLRKAKNQMAIKLNEANIIQQRLMVELETIRFSNSQMQNFSSTFMKGSPERSVVIESPQRDRGQGLNKDTIIFRMEQDIKNLQSLLQEKQNECESWKKQVVGY